MYCPATSKNCESTGCTLHRCALQVTQEKETTVSITPEAEDAFNDFIEKRGYKLGIVSSTEVSEAKYVDLLEAGKSIIERMSEQYKAGNGRMCGIQDEHGDKMYIVPFDDIERLREVLSTPVDTKRKWKWDIHFSTLFDSIETMDEFFKELMKQMNVVTNNSQFEILKVDGNPISFTALPVPDKFKPRTRPGSTRVRPMPRIPDPITYTIRFEKFEEPAPTPSPSTTVKEEPEVFNFIKWMDKRGWLQNAQDGCLFNDGLGNNYDLESVWGFYVKENGYNLPNQSSGEELEQAFHKGVKWRDDHPINKMFSQNDTVKEPLFGFIKWMNEPVMKYSIQGRSMLRCTPQAPDYNTYLLYEDKGKGMSINSDTKFYTLEELYDHFKSQSLSSQYKEEK